MKHAYATHLFGAMADPGVIVDLATTAEATGWDAFLVWDHLWPPSPGACADPWVTLTAIACATERIRLGPMVTPLSRRRPWKVAREALTLDHVSGGRLTLGVGLGVDFAREFSAFGGAEAPDDRARAELVDDGLEIVTRLWTGEPVTYRGTRLSVDDARMLPTPVQQPRIPIWCAALWPLRDGPAARAARWDGIVPYSPAGLMSLDEVRELVAEMRRRREGDDRPFDICVTGGRVDASAFEDAGVTWLAQGPGPDEGIDDVRAQIEVGPPR